MAIGMPLQGEAITHRDLQVVNVGFEAGRDPGVSTAACCPQSKSCPLWGISALMPLLGSLNLKGLAWRTAKGTTT